MKPTVIALLFMLPLCSCAKPPLRVCADPNNLPFSNSKREGFENKIVQRLADGLGRRVAYVWWVQHRGYVRATLDTRSCDLWPGVASGMRGLATTRPYYRSSYVFVSRTDRNLHIQSFDDPGLRNLKIGIQMIGSDGMHTPPAHALARRGLVDNLEPFLVDVDSDRVNPTAAIIEAVDRGGIDLAVVWGPLAGYFAARAKHPMRITPTPAEHDPQSPMAFDIAMGLRPGDPKLKRAVDRVLEEDRPMIEHILAEYHVPDAAPESVAEPTSRRTTTQAAD